MNRSFDVGGRILNMVVRIERTSAGPLYGDVDGGVERLPRMVGRSSGREGLDRTRWIRRLYDGMNSVDIFWLDGYPN